MGKAHPTLDARAAAEDREEKSVSDAAQISGILSGFFSLPRGK